MLSENVSRPKITLFMLQSLDGKINSGDSDILDVDKDWKNIPGLREGLPQYYALEQETSLCSLNTGRVMAKIGVNERMEMPEKNPCTFVIIDNQPHLNENGVSYLCNWVTKLLLVTTNKTHPAYSLRDKINNLEIMEYDELNLPRLMSDLAEKHQIEEITVQSGGQMNGLFLRDGLFDYVNIVIAPVLVGGKNTPTIIDGESLHAPEELNKLGILELLECNKLENSYMQLVYKVKH